MRTRGLLSSPAANREQGACARHLKRTAHTQSSAVAARVFTGLEAQWEQHLGRQRMNQLRHMLGELARLQAAPPETATRPAAPGA
jgi:hypothetical protein